MQIADFDLLTAQRRIFQSGLRPPERLVLLALLDHWSIASPNPHPSLNRLAKWTGFERTTVMRSLNSLLETGVIETVGRHRNGSSRSFNLRGVMTLPVAESHRLQGSTGCRESPVAQSNPTGCTESPPPVAQSNPKEPRKEPTEGTKDCAPQSDPPPLTLECQPSKPERKAQPNRKRSKPSKAEAAPDPRVTQLRDHYVSEYQRTQHADPVIAPSQWGRAMKALKSLLEASKDFERAKHIVTEAFVTELWDCRGKFQPWEILANANKLNVAKPGPRKSYNQPARQHNGVDVWKTSAQEEES